MSLHTLAGEVIASAVAQLAVLVLAAIAIVAVVSAILIVVRALRQRHDADRQALARRNGSQRTPRPLSVVPQ